MFVLFQYIYFLDTVTSISVASLRWCKATGGIRVQRGWLFINKLFFYFLIDPKNIKNKYFQRSYGFSIFICL